MRNEMGINRTELGLCLRKIFILSYTRDQLNAPHNAVWIVFETTKLYVIIEYLYYARAHRYTGA